MTTFSGARPAQPGDRPVAVVTGASRGLGLLLARELGLRGHDLVICARSAHGLAAAEADLATTGVQILAVPADVGRRSDARRLITAALERFGRLDILVANAGVIQVGPVASMRVEDYEEALGAIFWGFAYPVLAALPEMRRRGGGRIVAVTSVGGRFPAPHLAPYVAAKFAVAGLADALRAELRPDGISVTTVVPGLMRTGSPRNALFKGDSAAEYRWFTLGDSIPGVSTDAERAARRIVEGALRGRGQIVLTPAAKIASRLYGLAPATTVRLVGLVNRLLPAGTNPHAVPGHAVEAAGVPGWFSAATRLTDRAADRYHQYDDVTTTGPRRPAAASGADMAW